ncbi:YDG/SRA domain-containing protein [Streptomyces sp. NBC_01178]|uniref:YDG/SRA domain-containing protein n=1 Tax=Streptomyces sp. NBC_01178 TaxID=2903762 RepID=UPI00386CA516|nr:YDG/SRA domain-containing protein [Streptomyces sp. NBC_01178]
MIGQVPNVEAGREFSTRRQAHEAGVHRPLQAGICGTKKTGAEPSSCPAATRTMRTTETSSSTPAMVARTAPATR